MFMVTPISLESIISNHSEFNELISQFPDLKTFASEMLDSLLSGNDYHSGAIVSFFGIDSDQIELIKDRYPTRQIRSFLEDVTKQEVFDARNYTVTSTMKLVIDEYKRIIK